MSVAFVALGSNLGDRVAYLLQARAAAGVVAAHVDASHLYETAPVGPPQPHYLNAVLKLTFAKQPDPQWLLLWALATEQAAGRVRGERWGPRTLDVDLLSLDDLQIALPNLTLPHPRLHERPFVLVPLSDLTRVQPPSHDGVTRYEDVRW